MVCRTLVEGDCVVVALEEKLRSLDNIEGGN